MAEKLFYTMGEVAEMFDVNTSLIRHWESQFPLLRPKRNKKGNRLFTPQDVEQLKMIYHLVKECGMTLEGAKKALRKGSAASSVERDAELMERLQRIRALLVEVREDLKSDEGVVDDGDELQPAALHAAAATETLGMRSMFDPESMPEENASVVISTTGAAETDSEEQPLDVSPETSGSEAAVPGAETDSEPGAVEESVGEESGVSAVVLETEREEAASEPVFDGAGDAQAGLDAESGAEGEIEAFESMPLGDGAPEFEPEATTDSDSDDDAESGCDPSSGSEPDAALASVSLSEPEQETRFDAESGPESGPDPDALEEAENDEPDFVEIDLHTLRDGYADEVPFAEAVEEESANADAGSMEIGESGTDAPDAGDSEHPDDPDDSEDGGNGNGGADRGEADDFEPDFVLLDARTLEAVDPEEDEFTARAGCSGWGADDASAENVAGQPFSRSGRRPRRRKEEAEEKELFAFYEQSLF